MKQMMEKILENTYRNVNIGLVNELAILCNRMGIDIWEVIDAANEHNMAMVFTGCRVFRH